MEDRIRPTRTGLFSIELLSAIGVFTLCAAVCVGLFVRTEVISRESADLDSAVIAAQNAAECFKASGGDLKRTAALCGGMAAEQALVVAYDADWQPIVPGRSEDTMDEAFRLNLLATEENGYTGGELWITKRGETVELLDWQIAALEVTP